MASDKLLFYTKGDHWLYWTLTFFYFIKTIKSYIYICTHIQTWKYDLKIESKFIIYMPFELHSKVIIVLKKRSGQVRPLLSLIY